MGYQLCICLVTINAAKFILSHWAITLMCFDLTASQIDIEIYNVL